MGDKIIDLQESNTWEIKLTIAISYISPKDVDEEYVRHSKSDNGEFMSYDNVNDIVDEFFKIHLSGYQDNLKTSMRGSDFVFDSVLLFYKKRHRVISGCAISYIDSPNWIKKNKATVNPKNKHNF